MLNDNLKLSAFSSDMELSASVARFAVRSWTTVHTPAGLRLQLDGVIDCAKQFFSLPELTKAQYQLDNSEAFRPFGVEYSIDPALPDLVESFAYSWPNRRDLHDLRDGRGKQLYALLSETAASLCNVAEMFTSALAEHLGIVAPARVFGFNEWSRLQVNHSLVSDAGRNTTHELHDDGNFFTIACASEPGFELATSDRTLIPLAATPESPLIFAGEILQIATSGQIHGVRHHVRTHSARGRVAVLYFADADPDALGGWPSSVSPETLRARVVENWTRTGVPPVRTVPRE